MGEGGYGERINCESAKFTLELNKYESAYTHLKPSWDRSKNRYNHYNIKMATVIAVAFT